MARGVPENNSKKTNAKTLSGIPIRAMGALGSGKLLSANDTTHKAPVNKPNGVKITVGDHKLTGGTENPDKATNTD